MTRHTFAWFTWYILPTDGGDYDEQERMTRRYATRNGTTKGRERSRTCSASKSDFLRQMSKMSSELQTFPYIKKIDPSAISTWKFLERSRNKADRSTHAELRHKSGFYNMRSIGNFNGTWSNTTSFVTTNKNQHVFFHVVHMISETLFAIPFQLKLDDEEARWKIRG